MKLTDKEKAMGEWERVGKHGKMLITPSQEYITANTPSQDEFDKQHNKKIIEELNNMDGDLIRLIEDMAEKLEEISDFVIPQEKKDLILARKEKRKEFK